MTSSLHSTVNVVFFPSMTVVNQVTLQPAGLYFITCFSPMTDDRVPAGVAGAAGREGQVQGAGAHIQVPEPGAAPRQGKEFFLLSPQSLGFLLCLSSMLRSKAKQDSNLSSTVQYLCASSCLFLSYTANYLIPFCNCLFHSSSCLLLSSCCLLLSFSCLLLSST